MKKLHVLFLATAFSASAAFAELYPTSRFVDIGFDAGATASQNVTGVTDLLVEKLTVNFTEIADAMDDNGLVFNLGLDTDFFIDINTGENKGFGFFVQTDGSATFSTGKGLWDFLGHGNAGKNISSKVAVQGDMFIETGVKAKFKTRRIGWTVKPSYYLPVFYIPHSKLDILVETQNASYMVNAHGTGDFTVYSNFDMGTVFDSDMKFQGVGDLTSSVTSDITALLSSGGVAFFVEGEYQLLRSLCVGAYADIPVVAGRLKYKNTVEANFTASVNPILDTIGTDDSLEVKHSYDLKLLDTEEKTYKVRKPLRLGVEGAWRPFGDWCTFRPMVGIAARNPFGDDYNSEDNLFMEYMFGADITALYVLKFKLASIYRNQIFTQRFGFGLNLRVFELAVNIGSSGANFANSWSISGLAANVGLRFGF